MKFERAFQLSEIAELLNCTFVGDPEHLVLGMNEIHRVEAGDLVFVDHPKYYEKALNSAATTVMIDQKVDCPAGKGLLISEKPFWDFVRLGQMFAPFRPAEEVISSQARIGNGTHIQGNVFINKDVTIGENCLIHSNVSLNNTVTIGNNVIIHSGTVIGSDAFYYKHTTEGYVKLQSVGTVVIGDNVEIGANCTIDRGVTADTRIGSGTKIDNLVQIGHDTIVGENCLFASQVGVAGCTVIGNNVKLWGQVGIASGLYIGDGAELYAQSGVMKDLEGGQAYFGSPAYAAREQMKKIAALNRLAK